MINPNYSSVFNCPKCGTFGAISFLKLVGSRMIIKQRCPRHGIRTFKIPLMQKDKVIPFFHNGVFRCFKCGQPASVYDMKVTGPWTLIKLNCPTHGSKLPFQKIWSTVYTEITLREGEGPKSSEFGAPSPIEPELVVAEPVEQQPIPNPVKKFCPDCGTPLEGGVAFCGACGAEID